MKLFFSRRTYVASKKKFTNNFAALTRYVMIDAGPNGAGTGGIISRDDWLAQVEARAQSNEVVVFVHGFNTPQASMLERLGKIEQGLKNNGYQGAVVAFDWPSDGLLTAYDPDLRDAKKSAPFLVPDGILLLLDRGLTVHVLAHSMGTYLTLRAFAGEGDAVGANPWNVDQVLFAAADTEAEAVRKGAWGGLVLERRCQRFTNYYCTADKVLALSGGFVHGGRPRVGHVGMPDAKPDNSIDLYTTEQFRQHVPPQQQSKPVVSHTWLYDDAGFYEDAARTIAGQPDTGMPTRRDTNVGDRALLT